MSPGPLRHMKMAMAFAGPIPPAIGAPRDEFLQRRGRVAAGQASRAYLAALSEIESAIGPIRVPMSASAFAETTSVEAHLSRWEPLRARLIALADSGKLPGEQVARFGLARAVDANYDLSESTGAAGAHKRMHHLGEFVSGLYCCFVEWDAEQALWFARCAVALSHTGLGVSPGFTADLHCSICDEDVADCEHYPDSLYDVTAVHTVGGFCSICQKSACDHKIGCVYKVSQSNIFCNIEFQEGSLTPTPREPRARVTGIEVDPQPSPPKHLTSRRRCLQCLVTCPGYPVDANWLTDVETDSGPPHD